MVRVRIRVVLVGIGLARRLRRLSQLGGQRLRPLVIALCPLVITPSLAELCGELRVVRLLGGKG